MERERSFDGHFHGGPVQNREGAGKAEANRTNIGVRWGAELHWTAAEDLGARGQLNVHLEPDDRLIRGKHAGPGTGCNTGGHVPL